MKKQLIELIIKLSNQVANINLLMVLKYLEMIYEEQIQEYTEAIYSYLIDDRVKALLEEKNPEEIINKFIKIFYGEETESILEDIYNLLLEIK